MLSSPLSTGLPRVALGPPWVCHRCPRGSTGLPLGCPGFPHVCRGPHTLARLRGITDAHPGQRNIGVLDIIFVCQGHTTTCVWASLLCDPPSPTGAVSPPSLSAHSHREIARSTDCVFSRDEAIRSLPKHMTDVDLLFYALQQEVCLCCSEGRGEEGVTPPKSPPANHRRVLPARDVIEDTLALRMARRACWTLHLGLHLGAVWSGIPQEGPVAYVPHRVHMPLSKFVGDAVLFTKRVAR